MKKITQGLICSAVMLLAGQAKADVVAYVDANAGYAIGLMNSDGSGKRILTPPNGGFQPEVSPDGSKVVFISGDETSTPYPGPRFQVFVMNSDGSDRQQLTFGPEFTFNSNPTWSPDGTKIAWDCIWQNSGGLGTSICLMDADGTNIRQVVQTPGAVYPAWSPDGLRIAYSALSTVQPDNSDIYTANIDGSQIVKLTTAGGLMPDWSPDGTRIAFYSMRNDGRGDLYTINVDGSNEFQVTDSPAGEVAPTWSPDSQRLLFSFFGDDPLPQLYSVNADGTELGPLLFATAGKEAAWSTAPSLPVVNSSPAVQFLTPANGQRLNGSKPFDVKVQFTDADGIEDISNRSLSIQRDSDGLFWNGTSWGKTASVLTLSPDDETTYSLKLDFGARSLLGSYTLRAAATDRLGKTARAAIKVRLVDQTPPTVSIVRPAAASRVTSLQEISGLTSDAIGALSTSYFTNRVVVALRRGSDGAYWTGSRWSTTYTLLPASITKYGWKVSAHLPQGSELAAGSLYITAIAYDAAGNRSTATQSVIVQNSVTPPIPSNGGLSLVTASTSGVIQLRYETALTAESTTNPANFAVQVGTEPVRVEAIRYEGGVVTLLLGADALAQGDVVTVTWRNLQKTIGNGAFAGRTTVTVR